MEYTRGAVKADNGRLYCAFWRLESLLGRPARVDSSDGKVRVRWSQHVRGIGKVEIYDFKQGGVPVEQVTNWSVRAEPAVLRETVDLLAEYDEGSWEEWAEGRGGVTLDALFQVEEWVHVSEAFEDSRFDHLVSDQEWDEQEDGDAWLGLVSRWLLVRQRDTVDVYEVEDRHLVRTYKIN